MGFINKGLAHKSRGLLGSTICKLLLDKDIELPDKLSYISLDEIKSLKQAIY